MKYLNHITLNSGHIRKTYPNEVDKKLFFVLNRILKDSLKPAGAEIFEGYRLKSTDIGIATLGTIYAADGAPILTTTCSRSDDGSVWRELHETATLPLATKATDTPPLPYIADRVEIGAALHFDAMRWTGDFARCFGWVVLDPRKIR